jgi:translation initiation factor 2B subunit (eIF-2B alpha/beta/delta family)
MASLLNACAAAAADAHEPGRFQTARAEMLRAPAALRRVATAALHDLRLGTTVPRFVTLSYSGSVLAALIDLARTTPVEVTCAESRPRYEGRRLAAALARGHARVTVVTDAAVVSQLEGSTAVLAGADVVTSREWINKVGTHAIAATAATLGTPVMVVASRDKFLPAALENRLALRAGPGDEVWEHPPEGVAVANPIFESVPLSLATLLITERGALPPSAAPDVAIRWQRNGLALLDLLS